MNRGIVILGHGSRDGRGEANQLVFQMSTMLRTRLGHELVEPALIIRLPGLPTIKAAVGRLVAQGATRITIVPMLFTDGRHMRRDIPEEIRVLGRQFPKLTIALAGPIGPDPRIADILLDRIREV